MCEEWDAQYEDQARQLRQRVEEMVSGNTFEQIESVLSQIGDKDKEVQKLMQNVN